MSNSKGPKIKRIFENQRLFTPRVIRRYTNSSGILKNQTRASLSGSQPVSSTGSFRYDPPGSPLKSTQQLPLDFSKFENHTFFSSAESNVNVAFEKIVNKFPFDGTNQEYEEFLDDLSGFEKHVLDNFPHHTGYLTFDSNVLGTYDGLNQYIEVRDRAGILFPALSRIRNAKTILNPLKNSFSMECKLFLGRNINDNQFLFHHLSEAPAGERAGYAMFISESVSTASASLGFAVISGSQCITASYELPKGEFHSLSFVYDRSPKVCRAYILSGSTKIAQSDRFKFDVISTAGASLFIGSGSNLLLGSSLFEPQQTFSGSLDTVRAFSAVRKKSDIDYYQQRTLFSRKDLKLSYRFNEPTGSYANNDVVLDHSGKSLHAKISGWQADYSMRIIDPNNMPPMLFEESVKHPVLFPSYPAVVNFNNQLLLTASQYDINNPNLITKLIPRHYLAEEAASFVISGNPDGSLMDGISAVSPTMDAPGGARLGQPQIIASLLFVWAREFDTLKAMLDHVSNLVFAEYDYEESIANQLLPHLAEHYGFELPNMFRNAKMNQFFSGEEVIDGRITKSLQFAQNEIWRRILINVREIISSKGTVHAIKSLFRSSGIDPDRILRFVEYGGTETQRLGTARELAKEVSTLLDFSGSQAFLPSATVDPQGFYSDYPAFQSVFLSSSRKEVGPPLIAGTFVTNNEGEVISNASTDGLLTSGSWTIESRVKFPMARDIQGPQSIFRLQTTASEGNSPESHRLLLNVVATPPTSRAVYAEKTGEKVTLYCRPGFGPNAPLLELSLTDADIFDGRTWYVSCGRQRCDSIGSYVSSSYFLRVGKQQYGYVSEYYVTSSFFAENDPADKPGSNLFQMKLATNFGPPRVDNASGSFLVAGKQQIQTTLMDYLGDPLFAPATSRTTRFDGLMGHTRFWSLPIDEDEAKEHILNFKSLGVKNPLVNFGFTPDVTGSFQKLRLNISTDQPHTESNDSGNLTLTDFSQNFNSKLAGGSGEGALAKGFERNKRIVKPERFDFSFLSPNYDEMPEQNKVRVAGFTQGKNLFEIGGHPAPVYETVKSAEPVDDARFGIEFSIMQALDEDIMNIFATLESLDLAIGAPELMFAEEYPELARLRKIYFNRLTDTINYKKLFDFFRWLDDSFDTMIDGLIPRKTNYMGFNFIIEGHGLERPKIAYGSGDVYLGESTRRNLKGIILLRQLVGDMRKF